MDKRRGIKNVSVSILFKIFLLAGSVIARRFLIQYIGNAVNGLDSLYLSILNVLSVAELGIDSAIIFCMYKPVVDGDSAKVAALYRLFTKLYLIFALVIVVGGCAVMPALPYLAKDHESTGVNLYLTFGLMLISVVMSYTFSSKTSLINAYKNNYITTTISSSGLLLQYVLQIVVIITTQSFALYILCRILAVAVQWGITEIVTRKRHGAIIRDKQSKIDVDTKHEVAKNVKAMFMHKVGYVLVNTVDSIIISAFIGIAVLGGYSNYTAIMTAMVAVITLCFTPLTSVIGHMLVEENADSAKRYFGFFHTFNFILAVVFFLGYYAIIDNLIAVLFSPELIVSRSIAFVITVNYFIQFMRRSTILFRDASGTFYNNRWMPICEGLLNIVLSILFVLVFPDEYKVVGVIVATIITNLFICHIVDPHVLHKYAFHSSTKQYYIRNYVYIAAFVAVLIALHFAMVSVANPWLELLANGCIAVAIAVVPCVVAVLCNKETRNRLKGFLGRLRHRRTASGEDASVGDALNAEKVASVDDTTPTDGTDK